MKTTCLLCGEPASTRHHVAGEANDPDLVVYLCAVHAAWCDNRALVVLGVRLRHDGPRPPAEVAYARCAGMAALLTIALGPDPRIVRTLRVVAGEVERVLGSYVGPRPSETGPLRSIEPTGRPGGVLALIGAAATDAPAEVFERYCRRMLGEVRR